MANDYSMGKQSLAYGHLLQGRPPGTGGVSVSSGKGAEGSREVLALTTPRLPDPCQCKHTISQRILFINFRE